MRNFFFLLFAGLLMLSCQNTNDGKEGTVVATTTSKFDKQIDELLSQMTVEEKVQQMRMFHANLGVKLNNNDELEITPEALERLKNGIGGIKNPGEHYSPERAALLNNKLQEYIINNHRLKIPAFFVTESYNGVDAHGCTRFGRPMTMASSFNRDIVKKAWDITGREARLRGLHLTHSPEADLMRDPRFGRMSEGFSEDTYLVSEMVKSAITGIQGDYDGLKKTHIGAVAKHFAAYGQVAGGTNFASIEISPRTLIDEVFPPFKIAVQEAKSLGVMASHGDINGVASHANPWLLTEVLRNQWGFEGYVVSDANDVARLSFFMNVAETPEDAARLGLIAGVDVDLYSNEAYILLPEMVKKDPELMKYIDRSARRVLRTKFELGLFDDPFIKVEEVAKNVRSEESLLLAHEADIESIILLKNEEKTLPFTTDSKMTVALVGPLLDSKVKAAFEAIAGENVTFIEEKGYELTNGKKDVPVLLSAEENTPGMNNIVATAKKADAVLFFAGGDEFTSKEGFFNKALGDRDNIDPVGLQNETLIQLKKTGKPVVVVLKHRRTLSIVTFAKEADAIVDCWDLSEIGDKAIAKIVFGQAVPSGKSPVTIPYSIGQLPFHYSQKEINYKKGYLFTQNEPLYCFGHGLSYVDFKYDNLKVSAPVMQSTENITVSADITNTGDVTAKEVVQLYIKDVKGQVVRPMKELKGFDKIELKAGETKTVSFTITPDMLKFTGIDMTQILESGDYIVMVGTSSQTGLEGKFRLEVK